MKRWAAAVACAVLAGCAGTDFVRPSTDDLKNGQTTYAQLIARMGPPRSEGSVLKNEQSIRTATYAYASVGGKPLRDGVTPARAMSFYFFKDTLVGHEFVSSWAEDNTDFDENKIKDIVKGKSTRAQVVQLMGRPSGYYIYPMIKAQTGDAAGYSYGETTGSAFNLKFFRKGLVVTFDPAGVVTDVEYSSSGARQ
jgi:outer membrane protein assembly factor BamE (lipoprotein component of BamABCDE complex)